jgi:hypothetical protein
MANRIRNILLELKAHAPFTLFGAVTGITMMLFFRNLPEQTTYRLFYVFHPVHVVLSAIVTGSLFKLHEKTKGFIVVLLIGYFGSVGTATLSDSIIPFFGESILGVAIPTESNVHGGHGAGHESNPIAGLHHEQPGQAAAAAEHYQPKIHLGFIEEWYLVNPAALLGILIAYFLPRTKFPHAGHILISTWASATHIMMNTHSNVTAAMVVGMLIVLFIAVWLPCCFSDIVFPMLFVGPNSIEPHSHH